MISFSMLFLFSLLLVGSLSRPTKVPVPQGAEFTGGPFLYTNIVPTTRQWDTNGKPTPVDANNWPTADCITVLFDLRPFPQWQCPTDPKKCDDDPWMWQAPVNGTYTFSLNGKATVQGEEGSITVTSKFDPQTFTTSGTITLPPVVPALAVLSFTATQRTATSPVGSGFTNLRVMRPGHASDPDRTWSPEILEMMKPLSHVRFMGISGTNTFPGWYGDNGHHYLDFTDRCLPTDALWSNTLRPGCWGMPWEDVISLAQASGKGVWINMPVSATVGLLPNGAPNTSTYVYKWAQLLKNGNEFTGNKGIPDNVPIYIEHSNEVWNYGFGQYSWNYHATLDECIGDCLWKKDGITDQSEWARRRHAGKVYEIARTFAAVFGEDAVPKRVRPVLAEWSIWPLHYSNLLAWMEKTYGAPSKYLYAMSIDGYFGGQNSKPNMTIEDIYVAYANDTKNILPRHQKMNDIATQYGVKVVAYEGGPGWNVGSTNNLQNYIIAQRLAPMRKLVVENVEAWVAAGPAMDAYNHFTMSSRPSRSGMWGHTESFFNLTTPKWCAVLDLTGYPLYEGCKGW